MPDPVPQSADLLLLDDILPLNFSPFRTIEYGHYLAFFNAVLLSTEAWHSHLATETFDEALAALPLEEPLKSRIFRFDAGHATMARLAYVTFLHNAATLLPYLQERRMPFILQLYPGGGFDLEQQETDARLRALLHSPLCRKVIVTQTISRQYLLERIGFEPERVEFIYGGVFDNRIDFDFHRDKKLFGRDKQTLDLCFVAHRYGNNLAAKGFDHFVAVARKLAANDPRLRFHVVGDYTADDIALGDIAPLFSFYGRRPGAFFHAFYPKMDAIVAVARAFAQGPGAFDGFPTGSCIEAGFRGVLNCINDPLHLNFALRDNEDVVLLDDDPDHSAARLHTLLEAPSRLIDLAYANWRRFHEVFDVDRQLWARTRLIVRELLQQDEALLVRPSPRPSGLDGMTDNVMSYLHDQHRSHSDWLRDTERRHLDLIRLYRELAEHHEALRAAKATPERPAVAAPASIHSPWREQLGRLRAGLRRRLQ